MRWAVLIPCILLATGCVERRFVVTTDPPGALVLRNGKPIGASPADDHFIYYGRYEFTLIKEGYQTMTVEERVRPPWYQWFPIDFVTEALLPCRFEDIRRYHYKMEPLQPVRTDELLQRGQQLRDRSQTIPPPSDP